MVRREMQVEGRAVAVNLIEKDMRGNGTDPPASARRSAGSPARARPTARAFSATSRWNSGKAPSTSSKATVIAKAAAAAPVLRPLLSAAHCRHRALRLFDGIFAPPASQLVGATARCSARRAVGRIDQRVGPEIVRARRLGRHAALQAIEEMPAGAERAFLADVPGMRWSRTAAARRCRSRSALPSLVTVMRQPVSTTMEPRGALDLEQRFGEGVADCAAPRRCTRRR